VARWQRVGGPTQFGGTPDGGGIEVGWSWSIKREGDEPRLVQVEVSGSPFRVTDLPAEARNAIRSRGATAVDAFLDREEPPTRIVVSTLGVHPETPPRL
jgi:hypothetical protein